VKQRQILKEKAKDVSDTWPHFLSMTATPIPRSLALAIYGDLDLSIVNQMPEGRRQIITKFVDNANRNKAYDFIREQIDQGRQCFIICPLITESDKLGVKSVEAEYEKLDKEIFKELKVEKLHGKLKKNEKADIMDRFAQNKTHILISTSVVEVGVNVPNAAIMVIEGADRFGLSQLHQFRGRVGRAEYQSYCFLFTDSDNQDTKKRLQAFTQCNNGFELAQKDLEIRGPGEVYGYKQSGMAYLKLARLTDHAMIKQTREAAQSVIGQGIAQFPLLQEKVDKMQDLAFLE
jgi:ATP-dependent DNA helicase RecG